MKKTIYLAMAVAAVALVACNSKTANSDQQTEEQTEQVVEQTPDEVEAPAALDEPAAEENSSEADVAEEAELGNVSEANVEEAEPAAEEPAEEPAPKANVEEAPATPSDKFEVTNSDGNYITLKNEVVTADADGCLDIAASIDKAEKTNIRVIVSIEKLNGRRITYFPFPIYAGETKGTAQVCASRGGVFSDITPGEPYKISFALVELK